MAFLEEILYYYEKLLLLAIIMNNNEENVIMLHSSVDPFLLQVSTFAINYRGQPFMESLTENRPLLYSLAGAGGFVVMLALGRQKIFNSIYS